MCILNHIFTLHHITFHKISKTLTGSYIIILKFSPVSATSGENGSGSKNSNPSLWLQKHLNSTDKTVSLLFVKMSIVAQQRRWSGKFDKLRVAFEWLTYVWSMSAEVRPVKYNPWNAGFLMDGYVLAGVMNFFSTWGDTVSVTLFSPAAPAGLRGKKSVWLLLFCKGVKLGGSACERHSESFFCTKQCRYSRLVAQ